MGGFMGRLGEPEDHFLNFHGREKIWTCRPSRKPTTKKKLTHLTELSREAYCYDNPRVYHCRRRMVRYVCFTLLLFVWPVHVVDLTKRSKIEGIWPVHVVDLSKRSKTEGTWPLFGLAKFVISVKAKKKKMGFGGLPKQPKLPPENSIEADQARARRSAHCII